MRTTQSLSVTLPVEMAKMVKAKVSSGEYATESEVIRDGLRALQARDAAVEKWLREEVAPTFEAVNTGSEPLLALEDVKQNLSDHISQLAKHRHNAAE